MVSGGVPCKRRQVSHCCYFSMIAFSNLYDQLHVYLDLTISMSYIVCWYDNINTHSVGQTLPQFYALDKAGSTDHQPLRISSSLSTISTATTSSPDDVPENLTVPGNATSRTYFSAQSVVMS